MTAPSEFRAVSIPVFEPVAERPSDSIGALLIADGHMTVDQVEQVLHEQQQNGGRFGEIACRLGFVTHSTVDGALALQFGYPTALSKSRLPARLVTALNPALPFAESIRALRSQLMLRWFDGTPGKTALAITSVDRGDGKSFISANLAVAFSQLAESTLLIDADMRNPVLHETFGLDNRMGLSALLSGRAGLDEIRTVAGLPKLSLLPSGALPPNPQELLGRAVFRNLLNHLSSHFNVILLDTPSAQAASDAQVVAQRAGAALLVARKDVTRGREMAQLSATLANSGVQVLGATLNAY
ncbi:MAG TPA: polysaccharide biosynthesis tyrosine autokinase [Burkholderiaceae bacterium]|nr:polysaccharide biosynthesis tyrosine autokinase [Burkholderiaceae bacterium]